MLQINTQFSNFNVSNNKTEATFAQSNPQKERGIEKGYVSSPVDAKLYQTLYGIKTPVTSMENPKSVSAYNLKKVENIKQVEELAQKQIGYKPYKLAVSGYSVPPKGYAETTKNFLKTLDKELGQSKTAYITSPALERNNLYGITADITNQDPEKAFYLLADYFLEYLNYDKFPENINKTEYKKIPKYIINDQMEYTKAFTKVSNVCVMTGGRKVSVREFTYAIKDGNKTIILDNPLIEEQAWNYVKNRPANACKYILEQVEAFEAGRNLPYPEIEDFTLEFLEKNKDKIKELVKIVKLEDSTQESISKAAKEAAEFIK